VAALRGKIVDIKQTFGAINDSPLTIIPDAIKALVAQNRYMDMQSLAQEEEPKDLDAANTLVQALAPRFLEGIARSSEGSYILSHKWKFICAFLPVSITVQTVPSHLDILTSLFLLLSKKENSKISGMKQKSITGSSNTW